MFATFTAFSEISPEMVLPFLVTILLGAAVELLLIAGLLYLVYWLVTLPLRRSERTRIFLDLLDLGLREGLSGERAIIDAAASHDRLLSSRFYRLAAELNRGARLADGLARVPSLVPPQLTAILKTGERAGDLSRVLPACRQVLNDSASQVRGALNYLLLLTFLITPSAIVVPILLAVLVLPKFREVFAGMVPGAELPALTKFVFGHTQALVWTQAVLLVLFWILMASYLGGPRLRLWLRPIFGGAMDRVQLALPWRRKRLQRDFSAMLSILLDAQIPEAEAVALAARATDNSVIGTRAARVCAMLNAGVALPQALRVMDDSGELHWRISNALQRGSGFLRALAGWHESLDAKAFQLEQTAAQITTSALVLVNGAVVACVVISIFIVLVQLLDHAVLW